MKTRTLFALAALLATSVFTLRTQAQETIYHGFTRLDPDTQSLLDDAYVVVRGGRILALGQGSVPDYAGGQYVDMSGAFVLPGLVDAHAHLTAGPLAVSMENGAPVIDMSSDDNIAEPVHAACRQRCCGRFDPGGE